MLFLRFAWKLLDLTDHNRSFQSNGASVLVNTPLSVANESHACKVKAAIDDQEREDIESSNIFLKKKLLQKLVIISKHLEYFQTVFPLVDWYIYSTIFIF